MVTNFEIFENINWGDKYVLSLPSGEIIYVTDDDIKQLVKWNYIHSSVRYGNWVTGDNLKDTIKALIKKVDRNKEDIKYFLKECGLLKDQYKIYDNDLSVDAMGPVNMSYQKLTKIPVKFKMCTSFFNCSYNELETLENAPFTIHGYFNCSYNHLKNLEKGPRLISGHYNCSHNFLNTLRGAPTKVNSFDCSHNFLQDLDFAPIAKDNFIKNDNIL